MNICQYICIVKLKRNLKPEKLEHVAHILKTIAHPVRLEVLTVLEKQEPLSVSDILSEIDMEVEQSLLSHHLVKMKDRGLLKSVKVGKYIKYSLIDRNVLTIFDCMENCSL